MSAKKNYQKGYMRKMKRKRKQTDNDGGIEARKEHEC